MAGLLDSARDFERWLAAIESERPISHPFRLDPEQMYRIWLHEKVLPPTPPYQAAQWPAAMREAGAVLPQGVGTAAQPGAQSPAPRASANNAVTRVGFASPTLQPPQEPFAARMTGPQSANLEDRRTPVTADDVTNWLRNPYSADDQYWKW